MVFFLLMFYHALYFVIGIPLTGILHAVCRNDEQSFFRYIFFPGILMNMCDMMDRSSDGIQQCRAAAHIILLLGHWLDFSDINTVIQHLVPIVKKHYRDQCVSFLLFLPLDHAVESADGILLQSAHGSAAIEDHY